eukprot:TRINITY_DN66486_c5_g3_i1.p2 TRINITY_DN66486_c5_g3~~TRINITY_DN66486_c5_g3_i1.p2  ORF type:complete len:108 (-),score=5.30 TRINITY_DN66486_c5_g3_i1:111-434(-)
MYFQPSGGQHTVIVCGFCQGWILVVDPVSPGKKTYFLHHEQLHLMKRVVAMDPRVPLTAWMPLFRAWSTLMHGANDREYSPYLQPVDLEADTLFEEHAPSLLDDDML